MFCEKCGAQLPDGAKFCEKCGTPVREAGAPVSSVTPPPPPVSTEDGETSSSPAFSAPVAPAAPAAPSAAALAIKKFFSNKRNCLIVAAALLVVIVAVVLIVVISSQPKKVYLDDYFNITYRGCNGYATASVEWDEEALQKIDKKIFKSDKKQNSSSVWDELQGIVDSVSSLKNYVFINISYPNPTLTNGDKITVAYNVIDENFESKYHVKLKLRHETVEVTELADPVAFDPLSNVTFTFSGIDGYGTASFAVSADEVKIGDTGISAHYYPFSQSLEVSFSGAEGRSLYTLQYGFDPNSGLSNGDTVRFSITYPNGDINQALAASAGISVPTEAKSVTVAGLTPVTAFDPFECVTPVFTGYSSIGEMNIEVKTGQVTVGDYRMKISATNNYGTISVIVTIVNSLGEELENVRYTSYDNSGLSNGDEIKLEPSYFDAEDFVRRYGISLPESKTISCTGLTEPINPALQSHVSATFGGYEGYGSMTSFSVVGPDVYTLGDYTFKLTANLSLEWPRGCSLIVVVADKTGSNLFTVEYTSYNYYDIDKNGAEVTFGCSLGSSTRERYLRDYGIVFENSLVLTASGLTPTTPVDPRDQLTYSFSGENGSIRLSFGLKQSSFTVGNYTVSLEIREETSWGTTYLREYFTVTDASGTEVASGYYQASACQNLSEGTNITVYQYLDQDKIASETGLLFSKDQISVIVSTK